MKYTYKFVDDETTIEVDQRMSDEPFTCYYHSGKDRILPVVRVITGGCGTHFKGSGWTMKGSK